jgi:hypothetical protein
MGLIEESIMNFKEKALEVVKEWHERNRDLTLSKHHGKSVHLENVIEAALQQAYESGKAEAAPLVRSMEIAYEYLKSTNNESGCDPSVGFHEPLCAMEQDFCEALKKWRGV